ncbi:MAG: ABC transporter substrate-binding protein [Rhodobiaceae bacterium]|nr:ABC transporter substrate-binding protein [Rhodobiaceae bacterium]
MSKGGAMRRIRRFSGRIAACFLLVSCLGLTAATADEWRHATALTGEPKYPPDFPRFDYVNPDAPKGGSLRLADTGAFDSLNVVPEKGTTPAGLGLIYETLMTGSMDEVNAEYGLLAEAVKFPADFSSVTYRLREGARWHDGVPITPDDVIFSLNALKEHNALYGQYYKNVVEAKQTADREVTFVFDQANNRELPNIVGQLLILPKHYWEGKDKDGNPRDIGATTLEPPLGSGPYKIGRMIPGRTISYERVADYWGKDLPVNIGANNFDEIRYEVFRDLTVQFEAFKADQFDFYVDATSKNWMTGYDFPAVEKGWIVKESFPQTYRVSGRMQAWTFNLRRAKFQDRRVREAFNLAFDFEEMNKSLFYGLYRRINSYFEGTELESSGVPQGLELEILEKVRGEVPPEVFTTPYENPVNGNPRNLRTNLRKATDLLKEAGWEVRDGVLTNVETGEPFTVEFLSNDPRSERTFGRYKPNLERLGMQVSLRVVDTSQYLNRLREFDFDMISIVRGQSLSPGNEQRDNWGSAAADRAGSDNIMGIKNPAIDTLIDTIIYAKNREELVAATHALDRVLLWNDYVVPQWISGETWTARWNRFGHPDPLPEYSIGFPTVWWWDKEKAAKIASER